MTSRAILGFAVAVTLSLARPLVAQSTYTTGTVQGRVRDENDRWLGDARVTIGSMQGGMTNSEGRFFLRGIPPGRYQMRVLHVGYEAWSDWVDVVAGQTTERTVRLSSVPVRYAVMTDTGHPRPAEADTAPTQKEVWDPIARAIGLEPLRFVRRRSEVREIRFWLPPNMTATGSLIRFVARGRSVNASLYIVWALETRRDSGAARYISPTELQRLGCHDIRPARSMRTDDTLAVGGCSIPLKRANWGTLLRRMESHNVWTLPDESEITRTTTVMVTDGTGFIAEVLDGLRYHTYEYWVPELYANPETKNAAGIYAVIDSVLASRRKPSAMP